MNYINNNILLSLIQKPYVTQRELSKRCGYSLGSINQSIKRLINEGLIDANCCPTKKTKELIINNKPKNAIILAAGFGTRMVPINAENSKGMLEVKGEPLVERIIRQLHEVSISDITIVVGFLKEQYDYLIDKYNVKLVVNNNYANKNNIHSLALVSHKLTNTYIIPCDVWAANNPFSNYELYSWYMVNDVQTKFSEIKVNRKKELVKKMPKELGNQMIGICYLTLKDSNIVKNKICCLDGDLNYNNKYWEESLYASNKMIPQVKLVKHNSVIEINTYEQLRELDNDSNQLKIEAINVICEALTIDSNKIKNIHVLKKGMTNRSFVFSVDNIRYIMRVPGEGTDKLINRAKEHNVYKAIDNYKICDDIVYINPKNGYKITKFIENSRDCDPNKLDDLKLCMKKLRYFHSLNLTVNHEYDIFAHIQYYESLWGKKKSSYRDYQKVKCNVYKLKTYIDKHIHKFCLTHIDAVPDNFLISNNNEVRIIDWEYSGMQDPHVDIAMFCIYSLYDKSEVDRLIDIYFERKCDKHTRLKIYCYIAACGLLWSNWCEYKHTLNVEFGEYSLKQYRYAKDYYRYFKEGLKENA